MNGVPLKGTPLQIVQKVYVKENLYLSFILSVHFFVCPKKRTNAVHGCFYSLSLRFACANDKTAQEMHKLFLFFETEKA